MRKPTILGTMQAGLVKNLDASRRLVLSHVQEAVMRCSEGRAALAGGMAVSKFRTISWPAPRWEKQKKRPHRATGRAVGPPPRVQIVAELLLPKMIQLIEGGAHPSQAVSAVAVKYNGRPDKYLRNLLVRALVAQGRRVPPLRRR